MPLKPTSPVNPVPRFFGILPALILASCSAESPLPDPTGGAGGGGALGPGGSGSGVAGSSAVGGSSATGGAGGSTSTGGSAPVAGSGPVAGSSGTAGTANNGGSGNSAGSGTNGGSESGGSSNNGGSGNGGSGNSAGSNNNGGSDNGGSTSGGSSNGGSTPMGGSTSTGGSAMGGSTNSGGSGGVVTPPPGTAIDHGVTLVGYGAGTTGGAGKPQVTVSSLSQLESALKSDVTILVNGTISGSDMVSIKDMSNISIIGVGSNGQFRGIGLSFVRTSNIIIQNLSFENSSDDSINIEDTTQAWVDHNTMSTDVNYLDCDQGSVKDKYDGQIDIKKNSRNITVSFNYIHDSCKAVLLGFSDGKEPDDLVTYHHNRFENIGSRLPLIRSADTHVYNNYYKNVLTSGINVRMGANALIENNFFENVDDPILSADSDEIGFWNVSGNLYVPNGPQYTHQPEGVDTVGEVVNGEVKSTSTWEVNYTYPLDRANDVPPTVMQYAGAGKI